jgi:hypothetical protein
VAVTVHVPADVDVSTPPNSVHPVAVALATANVTEPLEDPPEVASVNGIKYVPEVEATVKLDCGPCVTVTTEVTVPPDTKLVASVGVNVPVTVADPAPSTVAVATEIESTAISEDA